MGYEQEIHMELTNYHEGLFFFKKNHSASMTIWDAHASLSVETSNLTTKCDGWEMGIPSITSSGHK
jgi:hypothetical protein